MNFEYFDLFTKTLDEIATTDLVDLDKLFLKVCVTDECFCLNPDQFKILLTMDTSKVILVATPRFWKLRAYENLIKTAKWPGSFIKENCHYLYQNYNFINVYKFSTFSECLIDSKVNILLYWTTGHINDRLRLEGCIPINLFISSKMPKSLRVITWHEGLMQVRGSRPSITNFQYIQLIDDKVYLKPPANFI